MSGQAELNEVLSAIERQTAVITQQTELLQRLIQIQESILILMADDHDPDEEPQTYMDGRPVR
jgi:hypothetical protein